MFFSPIILPFCHNFAAVIKFWFLNLCKFDRKNLQKFIKKKWLEIWWNEQNHDFKQKGHNNLSLDCWYPGGFGRYTRFKIWHPQASNQNSLGQPAACWAGIIYRFKKEKIWKMVFTKCSVSKYCVLKWQAMILEASKWKNSRSDQLSRY